MVILNVEAYVVWSFWWCQIWKLLKIDQSQDQEFKRNDEELVYSMLKKFLKRDCTGLVLG